LVYIRSKKVRGIDYAYLVRSVWNPEKNIARQQILKYLGRASDISLDKIPIEYRNDAKKYCLFCQLTLRRVILKKASQPQG
jgi:MerR family transcriptional regulator, light-induced transcriptional regulator